MTFTLDSVLGAGFSTGLVAAPRAARVAWIRNERGARSLLVAEDVRGRWRPRAVAHFEGDDGQPLSSIRWSADGGRLAFVRGGEPNPQGEWPNPTSAADGAQQRVHVVDLATDSVMHAGEGAAPAISPDGQQLAWVRDGSLYLAQVGAEANSEAEPWVKMRGKIESPVWSPDGRWLAFVSNRGDHRWVGVIRVESREIRWLGPSVDRDAHPAWSPDSTRVAFVRIAAQLGAFSFLPAREAEPWQLMVADVHTGRAQRVWRAASGPGSAFFPLHSEAQVLWCARDTLAFPWEGDCWLHLYLVAAEGGTATCLTPGDYEVDDVCLAADGESIVFSSNQRDVERRHLWRAQLAGGEPQAITRGTGMEFTPVMTVDGACLCLRSGAQLPLHVARVDARGATAAIEPIAARGDFPRAALVTPEEVEFAAADGMRIRGQLFLPRAGQAGLARTPRRPAIIFFHGGSKRQMLLGFHHLPYYHHAYAFNQWLASQGYIVLSVNYRSGTGYGLRFREAENYGASGASEYNDVVGAGLYLRGRSDVDPARIGLWGGSYGGYLTALGLARASDLFAAGVDIHGVHDWNPEIQVFHPEYDPLEHPDLARVARASSPLHFIDGWRSPVLLVHGDDDRNVMFAETVKLAIELRKRNVEAELLVLPDEIHDFLRYASWLAILEAAAEFFDRRLRKLAR